MTESKTYINKNMKNNLRKNLPLYIGIALPILLIIFVAVYIRVTTNFANPTQSFLFSTQDSYADCVEYDSQVIVDASSTVRVLPIKREKGKETEQLVEKTWCPNGVIQKKEGPDFYIYNFKTGTTQKATLKSIDGLKIKKGISEEGYLVGFSEEYISSYPMGFGPEFRDSGKNMIYIKKGKYTKKLEFTVPEGVDTGSTYYTQVIGWIVTK